MSATAAAAGSPTRTTARSATFATPGATPEPDLAARLVRNLLAVDADGEHLLVLDTTGLHEFSIAATSTYQFTGFASPTTNPPGVNKVKAGSITSLRWRVLDDAGAPVTDLDTAELSVQQVSCDTGDPIGSPTVSEVDPTHLGRGHYLELLPVSRSMARTCQAVMLDLGDGVPHTAIYEVDRTSRFGAWLRFILRWLRD